MPWKVDKTSDWEDRLHVFGPATSHYVCFRRLRDLVAVDPRNGRTLWIRQGLPRRSVVFGDDQHVFLLLPHGEQALLLRAATGELAGTRKMPAIAERPTADSCLAISGRMILLWQPEQGRHMLSLFDPLEGRQQWPEQIFAAGAQTCLIGGEAVAVMEPGGRFAIYSLPDGRTIAKLKLQSQPALGRLPCSSRAAIISC